MNQRVLLVGDDEAVLATRALLLQPLETVKSCSSDALDILLTQPFGVVVIGQSVERPSADWIIAAAKSLENSPALIAIRFPNEGLAMDVEVHETNSWKDPGWLKERVVELLKQRLP
jgi:hypothetical protein